MSETIKTGDYVRIIGNAKGSMWETGYVMDINTEGHLIKYGRNGMLGCYGLGIRKTQNELEVIKSEFVDQRPVRIKSGVQGCVNCNNNKCDYNIGSEYETDQGSDHCINRVFDADDELCDFINSQN